VSITTDKFSSSGYCELHMAAEGLWLSVRAISVSSATAHMKEELNWPTKSLCGDDGKCVQFIEALWKSVQV